MKIKIIVLCMSFFLAAIVHAQDIIQSVTVENSIVVEVPNNTIFEKSSIFRAQINGEEKQIKLIGVITDRDSYSGCFRERAAHAVQREINNISVDLISDINLGSLSNDTILYRYIRLSDGSILNETLIREGYYFVDENDNFSQKEMYLELEKEAKRNKKGIWGSSVSCNIQSFLDLRHVSDSESYIYNITVYQLLQFISLILLSLVLVLIWHFYSRAKK